MYNMSDETYKVLKDTEQEYMHRGVSADLDPFIVAKHDILEWCLAQKEGARSWLEFLRENNPRVSWTFDFCNKVLKI